MSNYVSRPTGGSLITMDIAAADHVNRLEILRKLEDLYSQLLTDPNQVVNVIFQVNRMLTQSKMFCWEFAFDLAKLLILLIKYTTLSPNQNSIIVFEFFKDVIQHKMECKFASPAAFNTIIDHIKSILPLIAHGKGPSNFPFEYYKRFLTICDPMLKQLYAYRQIVQYTKMFHKPTQIKQQYLQIQLHLHQLQYQCNRLMLPLVTNQAGQFSHT
ncbi:hypothetical protein BC833DRAFT_48409 [Globomyces pollinis-pini]|nr:hypothetical protein BC833DRAFT_48409 [Globomyces pollinis-pini]